MKAAVVLQLVQQVLLLLSVSEIEALAKASNEATASSTASTILRRSRDYHLLEEVPHDTTSFTQGLTYFDGHIYEGTGMEHESHLMRHDPSNHMKTLNKIPITPSHLFGEGISHYYVWKTADDGNPIKEHRLIQLTWKDKIGKIYSLPEMQLLKDFSYDTVTGEGWGITFVPNTNEFYVSDGSEYLMVWDAETLEEKRRIAVTFEREAGTKDTVKYVNELQFVDFGVDGSADSVLGEYGECKETCHSLFTPTMKILANVWYQDVLISIDPASGSVDKVYDLRDIYPLEQRHKDADCLNGISLAGDKKWDEGLEVWVTGKLWPKMYRIRLL